MLGSSLFPGTGLVASRARNQCDQAMIKGDRIYFPVANDLQVNIWVLQAHLALPSFCLIIKSNNAYAFEEFGIIILKVPVVKRCLVKLLKIPPIMKQAWG